MSDLERRLRTGLDSAGESISVPDGHVAAVVRRGRTRRVLTNLTVAAVVVVAVGAVWQVTRSVTPAPFITPNNTTTPSTTTPGSSAAPSWAFDWHESAGPPVDRVVSAWTTTDGRFAVWSGTEVWTSVDGDSWTLAATTEDGVHSPVTMHPVVDFAGRWFAIGGDTPTVFATTDGVGWDTIGLPADQLPAKNPLLQRVISATLIASSTDRVVIAGQINEWPDPDAVVTALAPDLAAETNQATADLNAREVQVRDQDGNLIGSVPFTDVDPRLQDTPNLISTILWSSPDGLTWDESDTTLLPGNPLAPASLLANDTRFVLGTSGLGADTRTSGYWESTDGVTWLQGTEAEAPIVLNTSMWGDKIVAAPGQNGVVVFNPDWQRSTLTVPFDDIEPKDRGAIGTVTAGPVGLVVTSYDSSTESTPTKLVWFTPDGQSWVRYSLNSTFGATGNVAIAAGTDRVLLILGPDQQGGAVPISPFQTWVGTPTTILPDTPAPSTTVPDAAQTTLATAPGVIEPNLVIRPTSGAPGDPLTICGTLQGATQVRVTLSDPATGDVWPDDINEFVTPDELGNWCWKGTIPAELASSDPRNLGQRHPITAGAYEIRVESFGDIIAYGSLKVNTPLNTLGPPSQSPADAARDGVVPELAELPVDVRVHVQKQVATPEGLWVLSTPAINTGQDLLGSCVPTDPECVYGRDFIRVYEYGEVLLMDETGQQILRAYPTPGFPFGGPGSLVVTDEAIYCASQGDGALPDSMLCRIDRTTGDWMARIFPFYVDSAFNPPDLDSYVPNNWTIDKPVDRALFLDLVTTPEGLFTVGYGNEQIQVDPDTLELLN